MKHPINHINLRSTMDEGGVDTIISAIYLMMERPSKNVGLDFAEVVRQFVSELSIPEAREFWTELKTLHPQKWPKDLTTLTTINSSDIPSLTEQLDGETATAGRIQ